MELRIGTSGWNYDHWKKRFYPEDVQKDKWFSHYATQFDTVEVNYSFYQWPSERTIRRWEKDAPDGFIFTLKAPRKITHIKKLLHPEESLKYFYQRTALLKEHRGAHLFQLPPSFEFNDATLARVRSFLDALDPGQENVIEFRHKSWWKQEIFDLFKESGAVFCTVSGLGMPSDTVRVGDVAYFRFHGARYTGSYGENSLKRYADAMMQSGAKRVYAYFNNDAFAFAVYNARTLRGLLGQEPPSQRTDNTTQSRLTGWANE